MVAIKKSSSKSFLSNLENSVSPAILNRWLWVLLILLAILFVVLELLRYTNPRLDLTSSAQHKTTGAVVQQGVVPFSNFEPGLRQRDLFSLNVQASEGAAAPTALDDEVQNYLVIGIVGSEGKEEAIVQDKRSRQTFFLTTGSSVGSLEVAEIRKQSIVLRRGNESRELFLP